MKVLILSCYTGEGHNSAAYAVMEALERLNVKCELTDPVLFKSRRAQKFVSSFYNGMIKNIPSTFGALYKAGALYDSTGIISPVYLANATYAEYLYNYIYSNGFDAVISTHLYGMEALTAIKKKQNCKAPFYGVLTDYTIIPFLAETRLDGYFIPSEELKPELTKRGIEENRIFSSGIPVSARFRSRMEKSEARRRLGIEADKKMILVMSGGIGGGNLLKLCHELTSRTDDSYVIYTLTGRNEAVKKEIDEKFKEVNRMVTVAFTKDVNLYMNSADVLMSKPGGLSSTEAAVSNVPLVHVNAIPGCETKNAEYFARHGMSLNAENIGRAVGYALKLSNDREAAESMVSRQRSMIDPIAADKIAERVVRL